MPLSLAPLSLLRPLHAARLAIGATSLALAGALASAAPSPALADEAAFAVDAKASTLTVFAYKDGFFSSLGHDHTIAARVVTGTVVVDPAKPEGGRVSFDVATAGLEVLDPGISDDDRKTIQTNMENDVLEVAKFPTITFRSAVVLRSARAATATAVEVDVTGDLTIHGTTRRVTLPVTLRFEGAEVVASGAVSLDQPDFGIEPYSALLGAVKVRKDVKVAFAIRARR